MSHTEEITDEQLHENINADDLQNEPAILKEEQSNIPVPENLTAENVEKLPGLLTEEYIKRVSTQLDAEHVDRVPEPLTAGHVKRVSLKLNAEHVEKEPEYLKEDHVDKVPEHLVEEILKSETFEAQFEKEPEILYQEHTERIRESLHEERLERVPEYSSEVHLEKGSELLSEEHFGQLPEESSEVLEPFPFDPLDLLPNIIEGKPLSEEISEEHLVDQLSELLKEEDSEVSGKIPDSSTWDYDDFHDFEGEFPEYEKSFRTDETEYEETRGETLTEKSEEKTNTAELHEELGEEQEEWLRMTYENEIVRLVEDKRYLRYRNQYIHKKLSEYLKKKNLTKMFREPVHLLEVDLIAKYEQVMKILSDKIDIQTIEKNRLRAESEKLHRRIEAQFEKMNLLFDSLLIKEKNLGVGLIEANTGKRLSQNKMNQLMKRQKQLVILTGKLQYACIQLQTRISIKEKMIDQAENVGHNLSLIDYEQVLTENNGMADKIEERDEELSRVQNKSSLSFQKLAQIREKCFANATDIQIIEHKLKTHNIKLSSGREELNNAKMQRDKYRAEKRRLHDSSGLLMQRRLLLDYKTTIKEVEDLGEELGQIKALFDKEKNELNGFRNAFESILNESDTDLYSLL